MLYTVQPEREPWPEVAEEVQVRGMAFYNLMNAIRLTRGQRVAEEVLDRIETPTAEDIRHRGLDPMSFHPVGILRDLYAATLLVTGEDHRIAREVGRFTMEHNLPVIYRMFAHVLSPDFVIHRAHTIFRRFYDRGEVRMVERSRGWGVMQVEGCVGFDRCIWNDILGGAEGGLKAVGARDLELEFLEGGGDEDEHARIAARWEGGSHFPPRW